MYAHTVDKTQQDKWFRSSIPFRVRPSVDNFSSALPFCKRFNMSGDSYAATPDTWPATTSFPIGNRTHLSSNHFQWPHSRRSVSLFSGTARHSKHRFYRSWFYSVKRLISSMTSTLNFTPTVSPFFMNRESLENRESLDHANHSPLQWITSIRTLITKTVRCEKSNVGFATFIVHQHSPLFLTQKTGSVIRHH